MDSEETLQMEENKVENVTPEVNEAEATTVEAPQTQEEVVAKVKELAEADAIPEKQELDALKQAFYKIHKADVAAARAQFVENGGEPEAFLPAPNVLEDEFKAAMNVIKQKRAELQAEQDRLKEENLKKKQDILERIKASMERTAARTGRKGQRTVENLPIIRRTILRPAETEQ